MVSDGLLQSDSRYQTERANEVDDAITDGNGKGRAASRTRKAALGTDVNRRSPDRGQWRICYRQYQTELVEVVLDQTMARGDPCQTPSQPQGAGSDDLYQTLKHSAVP